MRSCKTKGRCAWRCDVVIAVLWMITVVPDGEMATLLRVIDGDTIWVVVDGVRERVRYLGINAPERDTACGKIATRVNRRWLRSGPLRLVRDADVSDRDAYGRLLRYVYAGDVLVNAELVKDGVAAARRYEPGIDAYPAFARLQQGARAVHRGCL